MLLAGLIAVSLAAGIFCLLRGREEANRVKDYCVPLLDSPADFSGTGGKEFRFARKHDVPYSAAAFLVVMMLFIPCVATIAVLKKEMNSNKWFAGAIVLTLVVSYAGGTAAYQILRLLGL